MSITRALSWRPLWRGSPLVAALLIFLIFPAPASADNGPQAPLGGSSADLAPPAITVLRRSGGTARGLIFIAPKFSSATAGPQGPEIIDDQGRPVFFHALAGGDQAADFRVQHYRGEPVLTWTQGQGLGGVPVTPTVDYIVDRSYRIVATVRAGNGLNADQHEFQITPEDTALIVIYNPIDYDLSPFGGPRNGRVVDGIVQEIDIGSGCVLFEWHSLDHVAIDESHVAVPASTDKAPYDYFHINAVSVDEDHNLLVDARNTWAVYKVERRNGQIISRLGGTRSDFTLGEGAQFAWQHNPEAVDRRTVRIFDNEAAPAVLPRSRVLWLRRDPRTHTATLIRSLEHPDGLSAASQGNSQALDRDHTFVGWGQTGRFSEFDPNGVLLFDANVPAGDDTYRAYRFSWHARPITRPTVSAQRNADGTTTVHASWNGATDVARWFVIGGAHREALWPIGSAEWNGVDTTINVTTDAHQLAVVAQDESGALVGRSEAVEVSR
jgi:hypothetical protein